MPESQYQIERTAVKLGRWAFHRSCNSRNCFIFVDFKSPSRRQRSSRALTCAAAWIAECAVPKSDGAFDLSHITCKGGLLPQRYPCRPLQLLSASHESLHVTLIAFNINFLLSAHFANWRLPWSSKSSATDRRHTPTTILTLSISPPSLSTTRTRLYSFQISNPSVFPLQTSSSPTAPSTPRTGRIRLRSTFSTRL